MIRKLSFTLLALIIGLSPLLNEIPVQAGTLHAYDTYQTSNYSFADDAGDYVKKEAQTFTAESSYYLSKVYVLMKALTGQDTDHVRLQITGTTAGEPNLSDILANETYNVSPIAIHPSYGWKVLSLSTPILLTNGTVYGVLLSTDNGYGIYWGMDENNHYTGGSIYHYNGATWSNSSGQDYSFQIYEEAGVIAPSVTTDAATSVTSTTAVLNGNLTSMGSYGSVVTYLEYGLTTGYGTQVGYDFQTGATTFNSTLTNLNANTTYHYRAVAYGDSAVNGSDAEFTTDAVNSNYDPIVMTMPVTDYSGGNSATFHGNLVQLGGYTPVNCTFQVRRIGSTDWVTYPLYIGGLKTETGEYNNTGVGFVAGVDYEVRAMATNGHVFSDGVSTVAYGQILPFTGGSFITPGNFTVSLNPASGLSSTTATLTMRIQGEAINANDTIHGLFSYLPYSLNTTFTQYTSDQTRIGNGTMTTIISGLTPNTRYQFMAYGVIASGQVGTSDWQYFTTLSSTGGTPTPTVTPTVTPTPTPGAGSTDPLDWFLTAIGHYFAVFIGMIATLIIAVFVGGRKFGAPIGGLACIVEFGAAWQAAWIDPTVMTFVGVLIGYIVWRMFFSAKGAV